MKKIHLYDFYNPQQCKEKTGHYINPDILARHDKYQISKYDFADVGPHLIGYNGRWHIDVIQENLSQNPNDNSPFQIAVCHVGPHGHWRCPARVFLILEDIDE